MFWCEHANIRKHVSEHSWLSGWVIFSILAHLAHLAQSYFSLIFSAINTYNCSWFDLTNKKICSDWRQKLGEKWPMLTTFFLTTIAAITGRTHLKTRPDTWQSSRGRLGRSSSAKPLAIQKCDEPTDLPTYRPTREGVESRVRD